MIHEDLTGEIIGAFYEVYNTLGYGFLEQVYQNAIYQELVGMGLKCEPQRKIDVYYKNRLVGKYVADMVVEDLVILELKAVNKILPEHECQLVNYLRATKFEVGLLLNFGKNAEIKRRILTNSSMVCDGFEDINN
jgi:GxxExxY protein